MFIGSGVRCLRHILLRHILRPSLFARDVERTQPGNAECTGIPSPLPEHGEKPRTPDLWAVPFRISSLVRSFVIFYENLY
jgi:hypothetical protein